MGNATSQLSIAREWQGLPGDNQGVLAAAATGLGDFIALQGGDSERVFAASGIDPGILEEPSSSLNLVSYCRAMEEAARSSGVDNFGLYYGQQFQPQALGLIGYIGLKSSTVEAALRNFVSDFTWHQHDTFIRLVDVGDCWQLEYQVRHGAILYRRQDAELTMGMVANLLRHGLGRSWSPVELHFEHARPEQAHEHSAMFGAPIWFDQPCNAMRIRKDDTVRGMPDSDPFLLTVMRDAIRRLGKPSFRQNIVQRARVQIGLLLQHAEIELEDVANGLDLSASALQKQLAEYDIKFRDLVDRVRRETALQLVSQRHMTISAIAASLGYAETSAFSRAFRRWFQVGPRQWRVETSKV